MKMMMKRRGERNEDEKVKYEKSLELNPRKKAKNCVKENIFHSLSFVCLSLLHCIIHCLALNLICKRDSGLQLMPFSNYFSISLFF